MTFFIAFNLGENPLKKLIGVEIINTQDGLDSYEFKKNMLKYKKNEILRNNNEPVITF